MLYLLLILLLIALDQISKFVIVGRMAEGESIALLYDFLHITYVKNRGVAFGMLQGKINVISFVTVAAIIGIIIYLAKNLKKGNTLENFAYSFILSGAIGNMLDRIFRGFVVDMVDFRGIWSFVFNLADVWINIGVVLIVLESVLATKKKEKSIEEESK
ncbi:signal peptidase II [uncultured Ilyobacter sp.]|uniref:signal peptidase II n=1 Tax=uncultured Ilyobacter sp. TaxID=544433 RepID=UPI0029F47927|nr:signal peptidase II [uncultured Ilyobacter sp.]